MHNFLLENIQHNEQLRAQKDDPRPSIDNFENIFGETRNNNRLNQSFSHSQRNSTIFISKDDVNDIQNGMHFNSLQHMNVFTNLLFKDDINNK